jgi:autotransporter passenger strand-loop-strand repeat protein
MTATDRSRVLRERRASGKVVLTVVVGEDELAEIASDRGAGTQIHDLPDAVDELGSGASISGEGLNPGITAKVLSGGFVSAVEISATAVGEVLSGGLADTIRVDSGGKVLVFAGGTAVDVTVSAGGAATISSGGVVELVGSDTTSHLTFLSGATLEVGFGATLSNFTVSKGVTVEVLSAGSTTSTLSVGNGGTLITEAAQTANQSVPLTTPHTG